MASLSILRNYRSDDERAEALGSPPSDDVGGVASFLKSRGSEVSSAPDFVRDGVSKAPSALGDTGVADIMQYVRDDSFDKDTGEVTYLNVFGRHVDRETLEQSEAGRKLIDVAKRDKEGRANFWEGVTRGGLMQLVPWANDVHAVGLTVKQTYDTYQTFQKLEKGEEVPIEELLAARYFLAESDRESNQTGWGMFGSILAQAPAFGLEFAMSLGVGAVAKKLLSEGAEEAAQKGAKALVYRGARKLALNMAGELKDKGARKAVIDLAKGGVDDLAGKLAAETMEEIAGEGAEAVAKRSAIMGMRGIVDDALEVAVSPVADKATRLAMRKQIAARVARDAGAELAMLDKGAARRAMHWAGQLYTRNLVNALDPEFALDGTFRQGLSHAASVLARGSVAAGGMLALDEAAHQIIAPLSGAGRPVTGSELMLTASGVLQGNEKLVDNARWLSLGMRWAEYFSEMSGPAFTAVGRGAYNSLAKSAAGRVVEGSAMGRAGRMARSFASLSTEDIAAVNRLHRESTEALSGMAIRDVAEKNLREIARRTVLAKAAREGKTLVGDALEAEVAKMVKMPELAKSLVLHAGLAARFIMKTGIGPKEFTEYLQKVGYDGVLEELGEESFNGFVQTLLGLDDAAPRGAVDRMRESFKALVPDEGTFWPQVFAFALPTVARSSLMQAQTHLYAGPTGKMTRAMRQFDNQRAVRGSAMIERKAGGTQLPRVVSMEGSTEVRGGGDSPLTRVEGILAPKASRNVNADDDMSIAALVSNDPATTVDLIAESAKYVAKTQRGEISPIRRVAAVALDVVGSLATGQIPTFGSPVQALANRFDPGFGRFISDVGLNYSSALDAEMDRLRKDGARDVRAKAEKTVDETFRARVEDMYAGFLRNHGVVYASRRMLENAVKAQGREVDEDSVNKVADELEDIAKGEIKLTDAEVTAAAVARFEKAGKTPNAAELENEKKTYRAAREAHAKDAMPKYHRGAGGFLYMYSLGGVGAHEDDSNARKAAYSILLADHRMPVTLRVSRGKAVHESAGSKIGEAKMSLVEQVAALKDTDKETNADWELAGRFGISYTDSKPEARIGLVRRIAKSIAFGHALTGNQQLVLRDGGVVGTIDRVVDDNGQDGYFVTPYGAGLPGSSGNRHASFADAQGELNRDGAKFSFSDPTVYLASSATYYSDNSLDLLAHLFEHEYQGGISNVDVAAVLSDMFPNQYAAYVDSVKMRKGAQAVESARYSLFEEHAAHVLAQRASQGEKLSPEESAQLERSEAYKKLQAEDRRHDDIVEQMATSYREYSAVLDSALKGVVGDKVTVPGVNLPMWAYSPHASASASSLYLTHTGLLELASIVEDFVEQAIRTKLGGIALVSDRAAGLSKDDPVPVAPAVRNFFADMRALLAKRRPQASANDAALQRDFNVAEALFADNMAIRADPYGKVVSAIVLDNSGDTALGYSALALVAEDARSLETYPAFLAVIERMLGNAAPEASFRRLISLAGGAWSSSQAAAQKSAQNIKAAEKAFIAAAEQVKGPVSAGMPVWDYVSERAVSRRADAAAPPAAAKPAAVATTAPTDLVDAKAAASAEVEPDEPDVVEPDVGAMEEPPPVSSADQLRTVQLQERVKALDSQLDLIKENLFSDPALTDMLKEEMGKHGKKGAKARVRDRLQVERNNIAAELAALQPSPPESVEEVGNSLASISVNAEQSMALLKAASVIARNPAGNKLLMPPDDQFAIDAELGLLGGGVPDTSTWDKDNALKHFHAMADATMRLLSVLSPGAVPTDAGNAKKIAYQIAKSAMIASRRGFTFDVSAGDVGAENKSEAIEGSPAVQAFVNLARLLSGTDRSAGTFDIIARVRSDAATLNAAGEAGAALLLRAVDRTVATKRGASPHHNSAAYDELVLWLLDKDPAAHPRLVALGAVLSALGFDSGRTLLPYLRSASKALIIESVPVYGDDGSSAGYAFSAKLPGSMIGDLEVGNPIATMLSNGIARDGSGRFNAAYADDVHRARERHDAAMTGVKAVKYLDDPARIELLASAYDAIYGTRNNAVSAALRDKQTMNKLVYGYNPLVKSVDNRFKIAAEELLVGLGFGLATYDDGLSQLLELTGSLNGEARWDMATNRLAVAANSLLEGAEYTSNLQDRGGNVSRFLSQVARTGTRTKFVAGGEKEATMGVLAGNSVAADGIAHYIAREENKELLEELTRSFAHLGVSSADVLASIRRDGVYPDGTPVISNVVSWDGAFGDKTRDKVARLIGTANSSVVDAIRGAAHVAVVPVYFGGHQALAINIPAGLATKLFELGSDKQDTPVGRVYDALVTRLLPTLMMDPKRIVMTMSTHLERDMGQAAVSILTKLGVDGAFENPEGLNGVALSSEPGLMKDHLVWHRGMLIKAVEQNASFAAEGTSLRELQKYVDGLGGEYASYVTDAAAAKVNPVLGKSAPSIILKDGTESSLSKILAPLVREKAAGVAKGRSVAITAAEVAEAVADAVGDVGAIKYKIRPDNADSGLVVPVFTATLDEIAPHLSITVMKLPSGENVAGFEMRIDDLSARAAASIDKKNTPSRNFIPSNIGITSQTLGSDVAQAIEEYEQAAKLMLGPLAPVISGNKGEQLEKLVDIASRHHEFIAQGLSTGIIPANDRDVPMATAGTLASRATEGTYVSANRLDAVDTVSGGMVVPDGSAKGMSFAAFEDANKQFFRIERTFGDSEKSFASRMVEHSYVFTAAESKNEFDGQERRLTLTRANVRGPWIRYATFLRHDGRKSAAALEGADYGTDTRSLAMEFKRRMAHLQTLRSGPAGEYLKYVRNAIAPMVETHTGDSLFQDEDGMPIKAAELNLEELDGYSMQAVSFDDLFIERKTGGKTELVIDAAAFYYDAEHNDAVEIDGARRAMVAGTLVYGERTPSGHPASGDLVRLSIPQNSYDLSHDFAPEPLVAATFVLADGRVVRDFISGGVVPSGENTIVKTPEQVHLAGSDADADKTTLLFFDYGDSGIIVTGGAAVAARDRALSDVHAGKDAETAMYDALAPFSNSVMMARAVAARNMSVARLAEHESAVTKNRTGRYSFVYTADTTPVSAKLFDRAYHDSRMLGRTNVAREHEGAFADLLADAGLKFMLPSEDAAPASYEQLVSAWDEKEGAGYSGTALIHKPVTPNPRSFADMAALSLAVNDAGEKGRGSTVDFTNLVNLLQSLELWGELRESAIKAPTKEQYANLRYWAVLLSNMAFDVENEGTFNRAGFTGDSLRFYYAGLMSRNWGSRAELHAFHDMWMLWANSAAGRKAIDEPAHIDPDSDLAAALNRYDTMKKVTSILQRKNKAPKGMHDVLETSETLVSAELAKEALGDRAKAALESVETKLNRAAEAYVNSIEASRAYEAFFDLSLKLPKIKDVKKREGAKTVLSSRTKFVERLGHAVDTMAALKLLHLLGNERLESGDAYNLYDELSRDGDGLSLIELALVAEQAYDSLRLAVLHERADVPDGGFKGAPRLFRALTRRVRAGNTSNIESWVGVNFVDESVDLGDIRKEVERFIDTYPNSVTVTLNRKIDLVDVSREFKLNARQVMLLLFVHNAITAKSAAFTPSRERGFGALMPATWWNEFAQLRTQALGTAHDNKGIMDYALFPKDRWLDVDKHGQLIVKTYDDVASVENQISGSGKLYDAGDTLPNDTGRFKSVSGVVDGVDVFGINPTNTIILKNDAALANRPAGYAAARVYGSSNWGVKKGVHIADPFYRVATVRRRGLPTAKWLDSAITGSPRKDEVSAALPAKAEIITGEPPAPQAPQPHPLLDSVRVVPRDPSTLLGAPNYAKAVDRNELVEGTGFPMRSGVAMPNGLPRKYIAYDYETSGLNTDDVGVIAQIGAILMEDGKAVRHFNAFVHNPGYAAFLKANDGKDFAAAMAPYADIISRPEKDGEKRDDGDGTTLAWSLDKAAAEFCKFVEESGAEWFAGFNSTNFDLLLTRKMATHMVGKLGANAPGVLGKLVDADRQYDVFALAKYHAGNGRRESTSKEKLSPPMPGVGRLGDMNDAYLKQLDAKAGRLSVLFNKHFDSKYEIDAAMPEAGLNKLNEMLSQAGIPIDGNNVAHNALADVAMTAVLLEGDVSRALLSGDATTPRDVGFSIAAQPEIERVTRAWEAKVVGAPRSATDVANNLKAYKTKSRKSFQVTEITGLLNVDHAFTSTDAADNGTAAHAVLADVIENMEKVPTRSDGSVDKSADDVRRALLDRFPPGEFVYCTEKDGGNQLEKFNVRGRADLIVVDRKTGVATVVDFKPYHSNKLGVHGEGEAAAFEREQAQIAIYHDLMKGMGYEVSDSGYIAYYGNSPDASPLVEVKVDAMTDNATHLRKYALGLMIDGTGADQDIGSDVSSKLTGSLFDVLGSVEDEYKREVADLLNSAAIISTGMTGSGELLAKFGHEFAGVARIVNAKLFDITRYQTVQDYRGALAARDALVAYIRKQASPFGAKDKTEPKFAYRAFLTLRERAEKQPPVVAGVNKDTSALFYRHNAIEYRNTKAAFLRMREELHKWNGPREVKTQVAAEISVIEAMHSALERANAALMRYQRDEGKLIEELRAVGISDDYVDQAPLHPGVDRAAILAFGDLDHVELRRIVTRPAYFQALVLPTFRGIPMREIVQNHDIENVAKRFIESAAWYQILNAADDPKFIREIVEQDIDDAMFKNDETTGELKELTLEEKKAFVDKNGPIKRMKRIGGVQYVAGRLTKTQDQHDLIDFLVNKAVLAHLFGDSGVITPITIDASNWVDERRKAAIPTADDIMAIVPGASTERKKINPDAPVSTLEVAVTRIHEVLPKPLRGVAVMALAEAATQAQNQLDMLPGMAEASMGSRLHKFNQLFTGELENRGWGVSRQNSGGGDTFGCRLVMPNNKIQDAFNADTELQDLLVKSGRKIGDFNVAAMAKRIAPEFRNLHDALLAAAPYSLTSADSQRLFDLRNPLPFVVGGGMFRVFNEEKLTRTLLTTEDEVDRLRKSFEETLAKGANLPLSQMTDMPTPMVSFFKDLLGLDEPHGVTWDDIKGGIKYVNYGLGPKATRADLAKAIYNISLERVAQLAVKSDDATQRHDQTSSVRLAGIVESMRQMSVKYGLDVNLSGMSMSSIYSKFGYLPANIGVSDLLATHAQGAARGLQEKYAVNNALLQQDEKGRPLVYAKPGLIDDGTVIGEPMWQVLAKWWADSNGFAYDATKTGRENAELIYKQVELLATDDKNVISVKYDKNTGAPSTLFRKLASGYESVPEFMAKLGDPGDADDGMIACMAGGSTIAWMEHLVQARQIRSLSAMGNAAEWLNTRVKTVAMSLSGFHIAATLESAMVSPQGIAGALLGATHAPLMRKFGATKLGKFAGITENTFGQNDALRMINTNDPYYQDVRDMLNVFNIPLASAFDNPADIDRSALRRDIKNMAKFAKIHNIPFTDASGKALDKMLYAMQDNVTGYIFQHIVNAVKITVTLNLVDKLRAKALKQNRWFDPVVEMRRWAPYINAEVGGIDPTMYPWLNPNAKSKLRAWMLSWQWTFGAWEAGGGGLLTQWATGFALHPDVQSYIIPRWLRMAGGIMYGVPMLFQLGITALGKAAGTGDDDDDKWWNWQNEVGREDTFDITPMLRLLAKAPGVPWAKRNLPFGGLVPAWVGDDSTFGRRRYYMHFGKQGFEIARWFTNPLENAWSKMALPVQRMFTAVVGRAPNSDFAESFAGEPFGESFWDRMGYVGGMFQPMSYSSWKRNRDAGILSAIGPVSKGTSATAAREAMKDLLSDYAEPKAYDALRSSPRYWNNHQALLADYLEALRLNGHDPQTEMKDAVRTVLTEQYREVYGSLPNRPGMKVDERRLANAIASLHRMNFIEKNLWKSIESRDKRNAGKVDLTDDVMKTRYDYVRDAFLYPTGRYDEPTSLP